MVTLSLIPALALLAGLVLGAAGTWWLQRDQLAYLRDELRAAQDRLLHAWQGGATIPPRQVEVVPLPPLDPVLLERVNEWESSESRVAAEQQIRTWQTSGWGTVRILRELEEART